MSSKLTALRRLLDSEEVREHRSRSNHRTRSREDIQARDLARHSGLHNASFDHDQRDQFSPSHVGSHRSNHNQEKHPGSVVQIDQGYLARHALVEKSPTLSALEPHSPLTSPRGVFVGSVSPNNLSSINRNASSAVQSIGAWHQDGLQHSKTSSKIAIEMPATEKDVDDEETGMIVKALRAKRKQEEESSLQVKRLTAEITQLLSLNDSLNLQVSQLEAESSAAAALAEDWQRAAFAARSKVDSKNAEISELATEVSNVKAQSSALQLEAKTCQKALQERDQARAQVEKLKLQLHGVEMEHQRLETKVEVSLAQVEGSVHHKQQEVTSLQEQLAAQARVIANLENQLIQAQHEADSASSSEARIATQVESSAQVVAETLRHKDIAIQKLNNLLSASQNRADVLEKEVTKQEAALSKAAQNVEQETSKLENLLSQCQKDLMARTVELNESREENERLRSKIDSLQTQLEAALADASKVLELQAALDASRKHASEIHALAEAEKSQASSLTRQHQKARDMAELRLVEAEAEMQRLRKKLSSISGEHVGKLVEQLNQGTARQQDAEQEAKASRELIDAMAQESADAMHEFDSMMERIKARSSNSITSSSSKLENPSDRSHHSLLRSSSGDMHSVPSPPLLPLSPSENPEIDEAISAGASAHGHKANRILPSGASVAVQTSSFRTGMFLAGKSKSTQTDKVKFVQGDDSDAALREEIASLKVEVREAGNNQQEYESKMNSLSEALEQEQKRCLEMKFRLQEVTSSLCVPVARMAMQLERQQKQAQTETAQAGLAAVAGAQALLDADRVLKSVIVRARQVLDM